MAKFTLFWRTGDREVVEGDNAAAAMTAAGYGGGAVRALDFYASGDSNDWLWNATTREWTASPDSEFGKTLAAMKASPANEPIPRGPHMANEARHTVGVTVDPRDPDHSKTGM